jgi:hypothetical protein
MHYLNFFIIVLVLSPVSAYAQCPIGQSELIINIVPEKYSGEISWKLFEDNILKKSSYCALPDE